MDFNVAVWQAWGGEATCSLLIVAAVASERRPLGKIAVTDGAIIHRANEGQGTSNKRLI